MFPYLGVVNASGDEEINVGKLILRSFQRFKNHLKWIQRENVVIIYSFQYFHYLTCVNALRASPRRPFNTSNTPLGSEATEGIPYTDSL